MGCCRQGLDNWKTSAFGIEAWFWHTQCGDALETDECAPTAINWYSVGCCCCQHLNTHTSGCLEATCCYCVHFSGFNVTPSWVCFKLLSPKQQSGIHIFVSWHFWLHFNIRVFISHDWLLYFCNRKSLFGFLKEQALKSFWTHPGSSAGLREDFLLILFSRTSSQTTEVNMHKHHETRFSGG